MRRSECGEDGGTGVVVIQSGEEATPLYITTLPAHPQSKPKPESTPNPSWANLQISEEAIVKMTSQIMAEPVPSRAPACTARQNHGGVPARAHPSCLTRTLQEGRPPRSGVLSQNGPGETAQRNTGDKPGACTDWGSPANKSLARAPAETWPGRTCRIRGRPGRLGVNPPQLPFSPWCEGLPGDHRP